MIQAQRALLQRSQKGLSKLGWCQLFLRDANWRGYALFKHPGFSLHMQLTLSAQQPTGPERRGRFDCTGVPKWKRWGGENQEPETRFWRALSKKFRMFSQGAQCLKLTAQHPGNPDSEWQTPDPWVRKLTVLDSEHPEFKLIHGTPRACFKVGRPSQLS